MCVPAAVFSAIFSHADMAAVQATHTASSRAPCMGRGRTLPAVETTYTMDTATTPWSVLFADDDETGEDATMAIVLEPAAANDTGGGGEWDNVEDGPVEEDAGGRGDTVLPEQAVEDDAEQAVNDDAEDKAVPVPMSDMAQKIWRCLIEMEEADKESDAWLRRFRNNGERIAPEFAMDTFGEASEVRDRKRNSLAKEIAPDEATGEARKRRPQQVIGGFGASQGLHPLYMHLPKCVRCGRDDACMCRMNGDVYICSTCNSRTVAVSSFENWTQVFVFAVSLEWVWEGSFPQLATYRYPQSRKASHS